MSMPATLQLVTHVKPMAQIPTGAVSNDYTRSVARLLFLFCFLFSEDAITAVNKRLWERVIRGWAWGRGTQSLPCPRTLVVHGKVFHHASLSFNLFEHHFHSSLPRLTLFSHLQCLKGGCSNQFLGFFWDLELVLQDECTSLELALKCF